MIAPFPLVDVSGSPHERGVMHGRQARERILVGISHYVAQLKTLDLDAAGLRAAVEAFLPVVEGFDPAYVEEMRGIAEGADVSFEEIVLINARTEVLKLAERRQAASADPDGCTALVVLPGASADGALIHAQNWDWKRDCLESSIVLRIRRNDGPDILTFTEAGALARTGFNAAGVAITGNYLESDRDYTQIGVPLALIRRKALESEHPALAMRTVYVTPKSASSNMIVSHASGIAINFECAPDETFQVHARDGVIVHANHWIAPAALAKLRDKGVANMPDTLYRDIRVRELLPIGPGAITTDHVKQALFDDRFTPWSVCRPPRPNVAGVMTATVAMFVMQPGRNIFDIAPLPALNQEFTRYAL
ncbi:MAG: C45 family peptidase [Microvirga sp.]|nr:C45 family peptidase [Microvirga sp.]